MNQYQGGVYLPPIGKVTKVIIICLVVLFLVNSILIQVMGFNISGMIGLSGVNALSGYLWTLITYPWLSQDLVSLIFNSLILWFLGSELETFWGSRQYLGFLIAVAFLSGLFYLAIVFLFFRSQMIFAYPLIGIHGLTSTLCVIYGLRFPERTMLFFLFPVKAKWFVTVIVAMNLYQGFFSPSGATAWNQIFCMGLGALWLYFGNDALFKLKASQKAKKKSHLRVVKDDDDDITYH